MLYPDLDLAGVIGFREDFGYDLRRLLEQKAVSRIMYGCVQADNGRRPGLTELGCLPHYSSGDEFNSSIGLALVGANPRVGDLPTYGIQKAFHDRVGIGSEIERDNIWGARTNPLIDGAFRQRAGNGKSATRSAFWSNNEVLLREIAEGDSRGLRERSWITNASSLRSPTIARLLEAVPDEPFYAARRWSLWLRLVTTRLIITQGLFAWNTIYRALTCFDPEWKAGYQPDWDVRTRARVPPLVAGESAYERHYFGSTILVVGMDHPTKPKYKTGGAWKRHVDHVLAHHPIRATLRPWMEQGT